MATVDAKLLVVVDDSKASKHAVKYVAALLGRRRGFCVCLVRVIPPFPPELLEHGGSEDPAKERRLDRRLKADQTRWIASSKYKFQKDLDRARATLQEAGISKRAVRTLFCDPGETGAVAEALLDLAKECRCRTIVVGRKALSWLRDLFRQDLSEELLRHGKGFSIWAIE